MPLHLYGPLLLPFVWAETIASSFSSASIQSRLLAAHECPASCARSLSLAHSASCSLILSAGDVMSYAAEVFLSRIKRMFQLAPAPSAFGKTVSVARPQRNSANASIASCATSLIILRLSASACSAARLASHRMLDYPCRTSQNHRATIFGSRNSRAARQYCRPRIHMVFFICPSAKFLLFFGLKTECQQDVIQADTASMDRGTEILQTDAADNQLAQKACTAPKTNRREAQS